MLSIYPPSHFDPSVTPLCARLHLSTLDSCHSADPLDLQTLLAISDVLGKLQASELDHRSDALFRDALASAWDALILNHLVALLAHSATPSYLSSSWDLETPTTRATLKAHVRQQLMKEERGPFQRAVERWNASKGGVCFCDWTSAHGIQSHGVCICVLARCPDRLSSGLPYSPPLPQPPKVSLNSTLDALYTYIIDRPLSLSSSYSFTSFRTAWEYDDGSDGDLEWVKGIKATCWRYEKLLEEVWLEGMGDVHDQKEGDALFPDRAALRYAHPFAIYKAHVLKHLYSKSDVSTVEIKRWEACLSRHAVVLAKEEARLATDLIRLGKPDEAWNKLTRAMTLVPEEPTYTLARSSLNNVRGEHLSAIDDAHLTLSQPFLRSIPMTSSPLQSPTTSSSAPPKNRAERRQRERTKSGETSTAPSTSTTDVPVVASLDPEKANLAGRSLFESGFARLSLGGQAEGARQDLRTSQSLLSSKEVELSRTIDNLLAGLIEPVSPLKKKGSMVRGKK